MAEVRYTGVSLKNELPSMPRITVDGTEGLLQMGTLTNDPVWRSFVLRGLRKTVALVESTHKRTIVIGGKGRTAKGGPWRRRTGELSRSFHSTVDKTALSATYGSQLNRAAVVELGTQAALGGPLKSKQTGKGGKRKLLAIPTSSARVGQGGAVWPGKRDDLMFIQSRKGTKMLVQTSGVTSTGKKKAAYPLRVMYILVPEVTIEPHPTLEPTVRIAQPQTRKVMKDAVAEATVRAMGLKKQRTPKGKKGGV